MDWHNDPIKNDADGRPKFKGSMTLKNDSGEFLASIIWFFDQGPFYTHAVDPKEPDVVRRIGPIMTLEDAKSRCVDGVEGRIPNLSGRAGYPRP